MRGSRIPDDVDDIIPSSGFVRHFVHYATHCTDAPAIYHVAAAATAVSVAVSDTIHLVWDYQRDESKIPLNLWSLIVGRSSLDRKSTAVNLATDLIVSAFPHKIAPISGSMEGLIEFLVDQPCCIFLIPELSVLLDQMEASYWKQGKSLLMDLYDGRGTYTRKLRGQEPVIIRDPRICLLGASAISLLDQTTRATDWTGGFLARMLPVYAERRDWLPCRMSSEVMRDPLITELGDLSSLHRHTVKATGQARALHARFSQHLDRLAQRSPAHLHGPICRLSDHVQRIAALYAITTDSDLSYHHMQQAVALGKMVLESIGAIGGKLARDPSLRLRNRVMEILARHPQGVWKRDLLQKCPATKRQLDPAIETLLDEEAIDIETWGRKTLVTLTSLGKASTGSKVGESTPEGNDSPGIEVEVN